MIIDAGIGQTFAITSGRTVTVQYVFDNIDLDSIRGWYSANKVNYREMWQISYVVFQTFLLWCKNLESTPSLKRAAALVC